MPLLRWNPEKHVRILGSPFHQQESNFTNRNSTQKYVPFWGSLLHSAYFYARTQDSTNSGIPVGEIRAGTCPVFTNRNATVDPKNWWNPKKHVRILGSPFHQQEFLLVKSGLVPAFVRARSRSEHVRLLNLTPWWLLT